MDFTIDSEQKALAEAVRDMAGRHPSGSSETGAGPHAHNAELWSAMAEIGLLGLPFAEDVGGFGASAVEVSLAARELGQAGVNTAYADVLLGASLLATARDDLLKSVIAGNVLVLPALVEPMRAFGAVPGGARATQAGDGWIVDGLKGSIPFGESATHLLISAQADDGTVLLLVEDPDVRDGVLRCEGTSGRLLLRGAQADQALTEALALASVALTGQALGAMEAAMRMTTDYLKTRKQFGVPLSTFQALTHRAADMYVSLELARSSSMYLAMSVAEGDTDPAVVSRCRVVLSRTGRHIGQEAIQLHGGIGMTAEYAVGHLTAMLTAIEHTYGDSTHHVGALAAHVGDYESVRVLG